MNFNFKEVGVDLPTFQDIENLNFNELKCICKFRHHESGWEWYIIAGEKRGEDMFLYCFVNGDYDELGCILLSELLNIDAMFCLTWKPCYLKEILN